MDVAQVIKVCVTPDIVIEALVYVDDIIGAGSKLCIEKTVRNLTEMEEKKKFTFSTEKSKYMVIKTGSGRKKNEKVELRVKKRGD